MCCRLQQCAPQQYRPCRHFSWWLKEKRVCKYKSQHKPQSTSPSQSCHTGRITKKKNTIVAITPQGSSGWDAKSKELSTLDFFVCKWFENNNNFRKSIKCERLVRGRENLAAMVTFIFERDCFFCFLFALQINLWSNLDGWCCVSPAKKHWQSWLTSAQCGNRALLDKQESNC